MSGGFSRLPSPSAFLSSSPLNSQLAQNCNHEKSGTVQKAEASKAFWLLAFHKAKELGGKLRGLWRNESYLQVQRVFTAETELPGKDKRCGGGEGLRGPRSARSLDLLPGRLQVPRKGWLLASPGTFK